MVYGFLLFEIEKGTNILSQYYTSEGNDGHRKKRTQVFIARVASNLNLELKLVNPNKSQDNTLATNDVSLSGIFLVKPNEFVRLPKTVIWLKQQMFCYVLICEQYENRLLGNDFLHLFVSAMLEQLKNPAPSELPKEVMGKLDEILAILHHFLPGGYLLHANGCMIKGQKRDIENTLSTRV
jgi:hypothetical protein